MFKYFILALGGLFIMSTAASEAQASDPANTATIEVSTGGNVVIEFLPDIAPKHVERLKTLTNEGFYNGITFHRVIPGFMAQTGDPTGTGMGSSKYPDLPAEFSNTQYVRGTVGMARGNEPDTANSQFFICFTDTGCSFLRGKYTVLGQVTSGMEYIDKVATGEPPSSPDKIVKMTIGTAESSVSESFEKKPETLEAAPVEAEAAPVEAEAAPVEAEAAPVEAEAAPVEAEAAPVEAEAAPVEAEAAPANQEEGKAD